MPDKGLHVEPGVERIVASVDAAVHAERCCSLGGHSCRCQVDQDTGEHFVDPVAAAGKVESESAGASPGHRVWSDRLAGLGALAY
jgi:hypothetical protein